MPNLRRMVAWTRRNLVPVVSSIEAHRTSEVPNRGIPLPCLDGSAGQRKVGFTYLPNRAFIEVDTTLSIPKDVFNDYQQVIFRKRCDDLLSNPKAERFLSQLTATEFILFGNTVETSIKALCLGLLVRNRRVSVVVDACGYWNQSTADLAFRQIEAKGARLTTLAELRLWKLDRTHRYSGSSTNGHERTNGHACNGQLRAHGRNGDRPKELPNHRPENTISELGGVDFDPGI